MDRTLPWFSNMDAQERAWVGTIAQDGIAAFVKWYAQDDDNPHISANVFGSAPKDLARAITLRQTVELVRTTIDAVEDQVSALAAPGDEVELREAVLRYGREIAFASAQVYAQAAEARGAWDARLEALVVDAILRGEVDAEVRSRAAALAWHNRGDVVVVVGLARGVDAESMVEVIRTTARSLRLEVLAGVHGDQLIAVLGGIVDPLKATTSLADQFAPGPIVVGPLVPDLFSATASASEALAGFAAVKAWPDAPRPVSADDLLPERALAGDEQAKRLLVDDIAKTLSGQILETVWAYLETGSIEGAARELFIHTNTVRYRLRKASDQAGIIVTTPRGAHTVRIALSLAALESEG